MSKRRHDCVCHEPYEFKVVKTKSHRRQLCKVQSLNNPFDLVMRLFRKLKIRASARESYWYHRNMLIRHLDLIYLFLQFHNDDVFDETNSTILGWCYVQIVDRACVIYYFQSFYKGVGNAREMLSALQKEFPAYVLYVEPIIASSYRFWSKMLNCWECMNPMNRDANVCFPKDVFAQGEIATCEMNGETYFRWHQSSAFRKEIQRTMNNDVMTIIYEYDNSVSCAVDRLAIELVKLGVVKKTDLDSVIIGNLLQVIPRYFWEPPIFLQPKAFASEVRVYAENCNWDWHQPHFIVAAMLYQYECLLRNGNVFLRMDRLPEKKIREALYPNKKYWQAWDKGDFV